MVDVGYWLDTLLSTEAERVVAALVAVVFATVALALPDRRDVTAVVLGVAVLAFALPVLGPSYWGEWHYWLGGTVLAGLLILGWDRRRG